MTEAQRLRGHGFRDNLRVRGVSLIAPDRRTVTGIVTPIALEPDSQRLEEGLSASVMVTVPRDQMPGTPPTSGSFFDPSTGVSYRIADVDKVPGKPGIEFICEFVERTTTR